METTTTETTALLLAAEYDLPSHNLQGDPLTNCTGCGVVIYAAAALGDQRDKCSDCRA